MGAADRRTIYRSAVDGLPAAHKAGFNAEPRAAKLLSISEIRFI